MKAAENPDLKALIKRLEKRRRTKQTATTIMAALGLIGFGVMLVPVLANPHDMKQLAATGTATTTAAAEDPLAHISLIGKAAVVYDLTTGEVLYQKNASKQLPLASITKLLTLYAATTVLDPNASVSISEHAVAQEGDSGLAVGETFAFKDLARLALVASSNDAAAAIAETAATKQQVTDRQLMASAAEAAGLTETYALNGTGLDESSTISGGYGSALDVAKLAGQLLTKAPAIAHATIEPSVTVSDYQGMRHTLPNTNQDIIHIPNPLMSKTGYTDLAGGNLVIVFDAGISHPVAVVVLGSTRDGRFSDVEVLVSRTIKHFASE